jgi:phosphoribosylanthranilate isomerase
MGVKIKICNVCDITTAMKLEQLGADFIGIHILWELTPEKEALYKCLNKMLTHTHPVLVTKIRDLNILCNVIKKLEPEYVQLRSWSKSEIIQLREIVKSCGYSCPKIIGVIGLETLDDVSLINELADVCEYLLFDSSHRRGGTGIQIREEILQEAVKLAKLRKAPFFLAGGLKPENVGYYIIKYRPYGVDVQTGVEIPGLPGHKDFNKVKHFIEECRKIKYDFEC